MPESHQIVQAIKNFQAQQKQFATKAINGRNFYVVPKINLISKI